MPHGITQGKNTRDRDEPIQIVSQQTIEKRGYFRDTDLLIVDEAHTQRKFVMEFIRGSKIPVIGLSATPFGAGLGVTYSRVVSTTTTDELIAEGRLAPVKVYAAREIDMAGAKVVAGEWSDKAVEERGTAITGDVVAEWVDKTYQHFGGPVKTLTFTATVNQGAEYCRQFHAAGYNFQQVSYKDGNDDKRGALIEEFRRPNSSIVGLVSCEALAKGFDVPDVLCGISARPFRKSFSGHIQELGRVMRSHPGKEFALWLDHSGNYLGFLDRMQDLFANGVHTLDDAERYEKKRSEKVKEKTDITCSCGYVLEPNITACPACGKERLRKNRVTVVPGELVEVIGKDMVKPYLKDKRIAWGGICYDAITRKRGDIEQAERFAKAQYRNFYNEWPDWPFESAGYVDVCLQSHIKSNLIRFIKRRRVA